MAYFSNGTEGCVLDTLCAICVHGWDVEKGENKIRKKGCPVFFLQGMWNYEQLRREQHGTVEEKYRGGQVTFSYPMGEFTREAVVKKVALDMLIPNTDGELCAMFIQETP